MTFVTITAGHSNTDPGAVNGLTTEAAIVTDMRNMVKLYLERDGIEVKTDGEGAVNKPLNEAVKLIKGSKLAVEFHCNASVSRTAKGVEALAQTKDKDVAKRLCEAVAQVLDIPTRGEFAGWKPENSGQHTRLAYVSNGGIILELFFLSNPDELAKWTKYKWLVAKEVAQAIKDYVARH